MPGDSKDLGVIRRCRDLVQLYYGLRMTVSTLETNPQFTANVTAALIPADPSRIRYEISIQNFDAAAQNVVIGSARAFTNNDAMGYLLAPNVTMIIERVFLSDLDAVTEGLLAQVSSANLQINVRQTFLTPLPVDET